MKQIYEIIYNLVKDDEGLCMNKDIVNLDSKFTSLTMRQRKFLCVLIAMSPQRYDSKFYNYVVFKFKREWFGNNTTFETIRDELFSLNVILKIGKTRKFYLNPLYHPSLSPEVKADGLNIIRDIHHKAYKKANDERMKGYFSVPKLPDLD